MRPLRCERCGQRVFFENLSCGACGALLGFVPDELGFGAFEVDAGGIWQRLDRSRAAQRPCTNTLQQQVCNWMVPADSAETLCRCCSTTDVIPALGKAENHTYWMLLEQAKRRLFYGLLVLGLPVRSKADAPEHGLSFQFLEQLEPRQDVLTGHSDGVITLNIAEADDARREQMRLHLHEPYRTLLGHFRHEIGHYYWDRLVRDSAWIDDFRRLFGDERSDYAAALERHYSAPLADWQQAFVSPYASAHPWEDWAECWAHYMHMHDGLETAAAWGLRRDGAMPGAPGIEPRPLDADAALGPVLIEQWLPVSQFINAMDRSLGSGTSSHLVLENPVIEKLELIPRIVGAAARQQRPALPADADSAA